MHSLFGKILKYILRVLLVFIVGMLLIGWAKFNFNFSNYINFLNTRDRSDARGQVTITRPASLGYVFRGSGSLSLSGGELSGDLLSGALLSGDAISGSTDTGLNAYDPSLENDLNNMTGSELTGDTSFGFTGADETSATSPADTSTTANPSDTGTSKTELLNLIRRHELNK